MSLIIWEEEFYRKNVDDNWELFKNSFIDAPKSAISQLRKKAILVKKLNRFRGKEKAAEF